MEAHLLQNPQIAAALLGVLLVAIVAKQAYHVYRSPLSRLPGPFVSKWTKLRLQLAVMRGDRPVYVHGLHQQYGPVVRISPTEVSIADKSAVRAIYKTGSPFVKSEWYKAFTGDSKNFSLFSETDRKAHANHRRIVAASFTERWTKNLEPYMARNVKLTVQRIEEEMKVLGYADLFKWFTFMANDVIGEAAFGQSFKTLELGKKTQFVEDIEKIGRRGIYRAEFPSLIGLLSRLPLKSVRDIQYAAMRNLQYGEQSIQRYWKQLREDPENVKPTLLTKEYDQVEAGIMHESQLIRDGTGYIVAGTDTTALTATYTVYLLSQNPSAEQDLIREVAQIPEAFTDDDLVGLPVLHGVMMETLRLRSPLSQALPRIVPQGGAELAGHFIPAGATIGIQAWSMHRMSEVYPDPESFKPERWNEPTRDMKDCFLAFGGGSRVCIGMHFAQMELRHALVNFYKTFDTGVKASTKEGFSERDMVPASFLMMPPKGGRCLVERR